MTATPEPRDRQVAKATAELRAQRPTLREAAIWGGIGGAVVGVLGVIYPVPPLGSTESSAAGAAGSILRLTLIYAFVGAALFSIGALLVRALRKAVRAV